MSSEDIFNNLLNYKPNSGVVNEKPKMKKSDMMIENIGKLGFNLDQLEGVMRTKGNQLIISIAGSGKTTALIFKIAYDITTGEATRLAEINGNQVRVLDKIWVSTFLKSGADELQDRLAYWQRKLGLMDTSSRVVFSTLHAEFKRALTAIGVKTNIIDSGVNSKNLKSIIEGYGLKIDGKNLTSDDYSNFESALTYTRNRLDIKRYEHTFYKEVGVGPGIIDSILKQWKMSRIDLGCVDFEDLQEMLYEECCLKNNLEVINYLGSRYNYIYVDEFQDTSQIQYEILKVYAGGVKKIVAIGDDDQTIYSWRGSYNKIITEEFAKDFNPAISQLSVNYRCPSNILKAIKPSLEKNENRFKKELNSFKEGGKVRLCKYPDYKMMSDALAEFVEDDVKKGMSVAILCRVNSDGLLPALMLDNIGRFNYSISGDGMTLDSYIGRKVIGIARLFTEKSTIAVRESLGMLTRSQYSISNIMKVCKNNKMSFWEIPREDLVYSSPEISSRLLKWRTWREQFGDIKALKLIYKDYRTNVFVKDTQFANVCRSVISSMETLLEVTTANNVYEFLEEIDRISERLKSRKKKFNGSNVRIATVHEFKGKEADSVYVWNDSVDVFPHKECDVTDDEQLEEERRVHYIACTRARKISTVMCISGRVGKFANEMDFSDAEIIVNKPEIKGKVDDASGVAVKDGSDLLDDDDFVLDVKLEKKETIGGVTAIEDDKDFREFVISLYRDGNTPGEILDILHDNGYYDVELVDVIEVLS